MRLRRHHCRACGLIFCDEHSRRRMRLHTTGEEPASGEPVRVCEACFQKQQAPAHEQEPPRPTGTALRLHVAGEVSARDLTESFRARRAVHNAEQRRASEPILEAHGRLCAAENKGAFGKKRVVEWERDTATASCGVCHRGFTPIIRRHHCRLCGSVVCADCSAHRKPFANDGSVTYRSCVACHELVSRASRASDYARARASAERSEFASVYAALSAAARGVRREMVAFEDQVTALGTSTAVASVTDVIQTQQRLEQWLATLMSELKRFAAIPATGPEAALKEGVKRAPAALLKEGMPRFHQLKRTLELKAERKRGVAPNGAGTSADVAEGGAGAATDAMAACDVSDSAAPMQQQQPGEPAALNFPEPPQSAPGLTVAAPPPLSEPMASGPFSARVDAWKQSMRDKVGAVSWPQLPDSFNNPWAAGSSSSLTEEGANADGTSSLRASSEFAASEAAGGALLAGGSFLGGAGGAETANPFCAWCGHSASARGRAASPAPVPSGPIPLDEYLIAKRCLIDLSRSSMLYSRPHEHLRGVAGAPALLVGLLRLKDEHLQKVLLEMNTELDEHAEELGLDPAEQLREFTAAITATKQGETTCDTIDELVSRLLGVANVALNRMVEDVSPGRFDSAREALHKLKDGLKALYMETCIPY